MGPCTVLRLPQWTRRGLFFRLIVVGRHGGTAPVGVAHVAKPNDISLSSLRQTSVREHCCYYVLRQPLFQHHAYLKELLRFSILCSQQTTLQPGIKARRWSRLSDLKRRKMQDWRVPQGSKCIPRNSPGPVFDGFDNRPVAKVGLPATA